LNTVKLRKAKLFRTTVRAKKNPGTLPGFEMIEAFGPIG
jgi:hypothetical protein